MSRLVDVIASWSNYWGYHLSERAAWGMSRVAQNMETGAWLKKNGFVLGRKVTKRDLVYDSILNEVADKQVLYMEFGVFEGAATKYWSEHLMNPKSMLHGFDTFEGLPEDWYGARPEAYPKGTFHVGGNFPKIDDPRVKFFKGLFQDTLPEYTVPEHDVLVLNLDPDLYSSAKYVLDYMKPWIKPGTYIYFDEFSYTHDELKAFDELITDTGLKFTLLLGDISLRHVAFRCDGVGTPKNKPEGALAGASK